MAKENKGKSLTSPTKSNQKITTSSASQHTFYYHHNVIADIAKVSKTYRMIVPENFLTTAYS